jgi:hypothetical protein
MQIACAHIPFTARDEAAHAQFAIHCGAPDELRELGVGQGRALFADFNIRGTRTGHDEANVHEFVGLRGREQASQCAAHVRDGRTLQAPPDAAVENAAHMPGPNIAQGQRLARLERVPL